jgi:very-short-patch-repair endonuclease
VRGSAGRRGGRTNGGRLNVELYQAFTRVWRSHQRQRASGAPCVSTLVTDATVSELVSAALQPERQQLLLSSASDAIAMASDWLQAIEADCDVLDEAFAAVATGLELSDAELRASWAARSDPERRRWIERSATQASPTTRAALHGLSRALSDSERPDAAAELDELLSWLPQRAQLVFGLNVSGPAAIRSLFAFAMQHVQQPVIALVDARLWRDVREQLDDRTRASLDAGRLPPLLVLPQAEAKAAPVAHASGRPGPTQTSLESWVDSTASRSHGDATHVRDAERPPERSNKGPAAAVSRSALLTPDGARSAAEQLLYELLQAEPLTRGLFALNVRLPFSFGPARAEVDFVCAELRLVLEVDGYHHFQRQDAYRRDRRKDVLLQHQGYLVSRHLAEDVHQRSGEVMRAVRELVRRRRRSLRRESPT